MGATPATSTRRTWTSRRPAVAKLVVIVIVAALLAACGTATRQDRRLPARRCASP